ncbi:MAG: hypothetical protein R3B96_19050 [Pirellulaceae bacterium]
MSEWNRDTAEAALLRRINYETYPAAGGGQAYRLKAITQLLEQLGRPHLALPFIHVAGTKGKGSTATMIASLLKEAGYRIGLYTSPHLHRIEERIAIDGRPIDGASFARAVAAVCEETAKLDAAQEAGKWSGTPPTYFDMLTATAWFAFQQARLDVAVMEVGLGGRLDSTNAAIPCLSVISAISLDHVRQLGATLDRIAFEKAGIIKPGVTVVSARQNPLAAASYVNKPTAARRLMGVWRRFFGESTPPREIDQVSFPACSALNWRLAEGRSLPALPAEITDVQLGMAGLHQVGNAALAVTAVGIALSQALGRVGLSPRGGLNVACDPHRFPGESNSCKPHRPSSSMSRTTSRRSKPLLATLALERWPAARTALIAISEDKDYRGILKQLAGRFDRYLLTRFTENPRALSPEALAFELRGLQAVADAGPTSTEPGAASSAIIQTAETPAEALRMLRQSVAHDELVVMTGSTFLIAEVRQQLLESPLGNGRSIGH